MIVKICGITSPGDAAAAYEAGVDWMGLNLVSGPRKIDLAVAKEILRAIPKPSMAVALASTRDFFADGWRLLHELRNERVVRLQVYGTLDPTDLSRLIKENFDVILVQPVSIDADIATCRNYVHRCGTSRPGFVLFDSRVEGKDGGGGVLANWNAIANAGRNALLADFPPFLLAGGLNPGNVAEAIRRTRPYGVDVSSGVESAPGRKDAEKMSLFVQNAKNTSRRDADDSQGTGA